MNTSASFPVIASHGFARLVAFSFSLVLSTVCSQGQQATQAEAQGIRPEPEEEELVVLSVFEVTSERDRGYTAASTLAGARISTNLKETPAVIGVLTREFLDDILATDFADYGNWAANTIVSGVDADNTRDRGFPVVRTRGVLSQFDGASRNYFTVNYNMDSFSIERLDVTRGPNAILYGEGYLGGMPSTNTKRALLQRAFTDIRVQGDSNGTLRTTLDVNRYWGDWSAIRVNLLRSRSEGWRQADFSDRDGVQIAVTLRPTKKTLVMAELEWGEVGTNSERLYYTDQSSSWNRSILPVIGQNPPSGSGIGRISTSNPYLLWNQSDPAIGLQNWSGTYQTSGTGWTLLPVDYPIADFRPGRPNFPVLPKREFTLGPKARTSELETWNATLAIEQTVFEKLVLQVVGNYDRQERHWFRNRIDQHYIDLNPNRPDGAPNPYYLQPFDDSGVQEQKTLSTVYNLRVSAAYPFDWGFMQQNLILSAGLRDKVGDDTFYRLVRVNNPANGNFQASANLLQTRRYWNDNRAPFSLPTSSNGIEVSKRITGLQAADSKTKFLQATAAGRYWGGKVTSVLGVRRDIVESDAASSFNTPNDWRGRQPTSSEMLPPRLSDPRDANGNPIAQPRDPTGVPTSVYNSERWDTLAAGVPYDPIKNPRFYEVWPNEIEVTTMTAGLVYFPVRDLGLFVNASEGFQIGGMEPQINFAPWDPPKNEGFDVGFKLELFDGKISGTASYYKSKNIGGTVRAQGSNIRDVWNNARIAYENSALAVEGTDPSQAATYRTLAAEALTEYDGIPSNYNDYRELRAEGYEIDLTANLTRSWRMMFNLGLPDNTTYGTLRDTKIYVAEHEDTWAGYVADTTGIPAGPNRNTIVSRLNSINDAINNAIDGRPESGKPDYTSNIFSTYEFTSGALKGLRLGGGANFRGKQTTGTLRQIYGDNPATPEATVGFYAPDQFDYLTTDSYYTLTATISYRVKIRDVNWSLQINVSNLLDEEKVLFTSFQNTTYTEGTTTYGFQAPNVFRYIEPRKVTLSIGARF